jgi:Escherichia/Staphylococcus phage prohead protease
MDRVTFAADASLDGNTLSGIAYAFGQRTLRDGVWMTFDRHAFDAALTSSQPRAYWNHNKDLLLGSRKAGTLDVQLADKGLAYRIELPDTSAGRDVKALVARGDVTEMSFGVTIGKHRTRRLPSDGSMLMTVTEVADLFDISPVPAGAFGGTSVQLYGLDDGESVASQLVKARHAAITGGSR